MFQPDYFKHCPSCTTQLPEVAVGNSMQHCTSCGWTYYFHTPQTAAAIALNENHEVLLVKRRNEPFKGQWSLPAGFVEYGEHPIQAALRELNEETTLAAEFDHLIGLYIADDHKETFSMLTIIQVKSVSGTPAAQDDVEAVSYFPLNSLPELAFQAHREALQSLREL